MRPGWKYRFVYTVDGGESYYQTTAKLLTATDEAYVVALRDRKVGRIPRSAVRDVQAVPHDTQIAVNQRWKGQVR